MIVQTITSDTISDLCNKAIDTVASEGIPVKRQVGSWAMQKEGVTETREIQHLILCCTNPLDRWSSRVNAGTLVETLDYILGLNPGLIHNVWKFYSKWLKDGEFPYTYGARVRNDEIDGVDQLSEVISKLQASPSTRHGVIPIWRTRDHFSDFVPCNTLFHFQMNPEGKLDMTTYCRSQDALRGLFLDTFSFPHFMDQVCQATGLKMGNYIIHEANIHIYERDYDKIEQMKSTRSTPLGMSEYVSKKNNPELLEAFSEIVLNKRLPDLSKIPKYWNLYLRRIYYEIDKTV
jgi:thymidylate synthase